MSRPRSLVWIAALSLGLAGCGGSGGGSAPAGPSVTPVFDISWQARSRTVVGPSSALSVVVTFPKASPKGADVVTVVDRKADPAAYGQGYAASGPVLLGARTAHFVFHAAAGGAGDVVATADLAGVVQPNGTFTRGDGTAFGSIQFDTKIASVVVNGPTTAYVGEPTTYTATAFDAQNRPLALTPGSFSFGSSPGQGNMSLDGTFTPGTVGPYQIGATVDGVQSAPLSVQVDLDPAAGRRIVHQPAIGVAFTPAGDRLFATTASTGANANSLVEVNLSTGGVRTIAPLGGPAGTLGVSADGGVAYAAVGSAVLRIDTATGAATTISLGQAASGTAYRAHSIAVSPADPNVIAVGRRFVGARGYGGIALYRSGTRVAETTATSLDDGAIVRFSPDGAAIFDYNSESSRFPVTRYAVGAASLTQTAHRENVTAGFESTYEVAGNRLYLSDGTILDADTLAFVTRLDLASSSFAVSVNVATNRAYYVLINVVGPTRVAAFDTASFVRVTDAPLDAPGGLDGSIVQDGGRNGRLALALHLNDGSDVIFVVDAPAATGNRASP